MDFKIKAEKRELVGRKVKTLRRKGLTPANIYGKNVKSLSVAFDTKEFIKVYDEAGETGLIEVTIGSEKKPVLIHNVQLHPVTDEILHADLLQVDLKEKVTAEVPVEVVGESPVEKQGLGTLVQYINEVEVKSLPGDIPERFEVDATALSEIDQAVMIKDLKYDKVKVEITLDPEQIVVKVEPPKKVEEEAVPVVTEAVAETGEGSGPGVGEEGSKEESSGDSDTKQTTESK